MIWLLLAIRLPENMYSQTSLIRASLIRMLYSPNTVPGSLALLSFRPTLYNDSVIRMFQNPNTLYNGCQKKLSFSDKRGLTIHVSGAGQNVQNCLSIRTVVIFQCLLVLILRLTISRDHVSRPIQSSAADRF